MTAPVAVSTMRIGAHQKPMTLCQLKSRARPVLVRLKNRIAVTCCGSHLCGHHRNSPVTARPRNARLETPVSDRPVSRVSPLKLSQR